MKIDTKGLRELLEKATPPPWRIVVQDEPIPPLDYKWSSIRGPKDTSLGWCYRPEDQELLAALRNAAPALLDWIGDAEKLLRGDYDVLPLNDPDVRALLARLDDAGAGEKP